MTTSKHFIIFISSLIILSAVTSRVNRFQKIYYLQHNADIDSHTLALQNSINAAGHMTDFDTATQIQYGAVPTLENYIFYLTRTETANSNSLKSTWANSITDATFKDNTVSFIPSIDGASSFKRGRDYVVFNFEKLDLTCHLQSISSYLLYKFKI